jgi:hypothetical protein
MTGGETEEACMAAGTRRYGVALVLAGLAGLAPSAHAQPSKPIKAASAAEGTADAPDCPRLWREYRRSQACFARYRTLTGINAEAFRACGPALPDPSAQCGPRRDPSSPADSRR